MSRTSDGSSHLGDLVSALVDGELGHDCRDRVLAHLATCAQCRARAEAERQVKAALAQTTLPPPPLELSARLRALADPDAGPPAGVPPAERRDHGARAGRSATRPPSGAASRGAASRGAAVTGASTAGQLRANRRGSRVALLAAGAATVSGAALGGTVVLGAPAAQPPLPASPPMDALAAQRATSSAPAPAADSATGALQLAAVGGTFLLRPGAMVTSASPRRAAGVESPPPFRSPSRVVGAQPAVLVSYESLILSGSNPSGSTPYNSTASGNDLLGTLARSRWVGAPR